jgi:hypothetical protein
MRKFYALSAGVLVLVLVGVSQAKPVTPTFKVGVLTTSTGPLYFVDPIQKSACNLVSQDLADSGIKVTCVYEDLSSTDAFRKLRNQNVDVVIGPVDSENTSVALAANNRDPLVILEPSAVEDQLDGSVSGTNWLFRTSTTTNQDNLALVDLIARDKRPNVAIVYGSDAYSQQTRSSLVMGMVLRGIGNVHSYSIKDVKTISQTRPDVLILDSLEESVDFFDSMKDWVSRVKKVYLVQGNLANYSMFGWAKILDGAQSVAPLDSTTADFRTRIATSMNKPYLLSSPNSPIFALAKRIYDSVLLAARNYKSGDSHQSYRDRLAQTKNDGKLVFDKDGYLINPRYTIYRYTASGMFGAVAVFDPNTP